MSIQHTPEDVPSKPLHVFTGRGRKLLKLNDDLPATLVVEFRNEGRNLGYVHRKSRRWSGKKSIASTSRSKTTRVILERRAPFTHERYLKVSARGPWTVSLLDLAGVPCFTEGLSGDEDDVARYNGGPALLRVTTERKGDFFSLESLNDGVPRILAWNDGFVPLSGPTLLTIDSIYLWRLEVEPITPGHLPVPTFDRTIQGEGAGVVRYTGPDAQGRFQISGGHLSRVDLLDEKLEQIRNLIDTRDSEETVHLETGALLRIVVSRGYWSFSTG